MSDIGEVALSLLHMRGVEREESRPGKARGTPEPPAGKPGAEQ